ncbi:MULTISPECIES: NAD(P)/FAD-dependent oxidoreductase [Halorussus]|uniref:NAD(P)/FAD-dependent oxidoreductase n=1 Tax=Halorussus TaxID=1070314 RepID=UPI0020A11FE8|nr:NAD(P)/FAD-dependent oxidoreductase [Halorussus vallis]USZ74642.1 NAD(P)/FAD-dependent oxidoreductase [Halorussus vallis]
MSRTPTYEVVVVGGGPAGLTTALYATRLGHRTALVNREGGRYESVAAVHNLLAVSEDATGRGVTELGIEQLVEYGADYYEDDVRSVEERADSDADAQFQITAERADLLADRVVFATGFTDEPPRVPGLRRFTGRGLHYCLHCDAYTLGDAPVFVLGHDDHAAHAAMVLLNFTDDVDLLTNDEEPTWSDAVDEQVRAHPVDVVEDRVDHAFPEREGEDERTDPDEPPWLGGLEFADGRSREYAGGFAMYGQEYNAELADRLGCERNEDGSIAVNDRRETSVEGAYAVGDLTHGQNQTPIALGDGAYAGIALHKDLRTFPLPPGELDDVETEDVPSAPDDIRARMRRVRELDEHAGMRPE